MQLPPSSGEFARSFSAQMYLMWVPSAGIAGCTLNCEIPVPLGVACWQYSGDTINTEGTMYLNAVAVPVQTNGSGWAWTSGGRRGLTPHTPLIRVADLALNPANHQVTRSGHGMLLDR